MSSGAEQFDGRRERSRRTRIRIAKAATGLFVEQGYAATTMAAIADAADVAQPTVYASFGTKSAVLAAALDLAIAGDDKAVPVSDRPWMQPVWHADTAEQRLRAYATAVRRIHAGAADMFVVVDAAAGVDREAAELAAVTEDRRRVGAAAVVDAVSAVGELRGDRTSAIDVLTMLNSPSTFHHLVRRRNWSLDRYEQWLAEVLVRELLHDGSDEG
jgi:AcrR family transcriptional regulator